MPVHFEIDAEPSLVVADESIIVVRKPWRMHTAPLPRPEGRAEGSRTSLCDWVFDRFPDAAAASAGSDRRLPGEGGLIHRLDFETSGLVLFARSPASLAFLIAEQDRGGISKEYLARCGATESFSPEGSRPPRVAPSGIPGPGWSRALSRALGGEALEVAALIDHFGALGAFALIEGRFRPFGPGARRVACLAAGFEGRSGATKELYSTALAGALAVGGELELRVRLASGFRHQVRAHLAWIGFPILGDALYGDREAGRLHLHAARLEFRHPRDGEPLVVEG